MTREDEEQRKPNRRFALAVVLFIVILFGLFVGSIGWLVYSLSGGGVPRKSAAFETWRDDNRDGIWDAGEAGVAYVYIDVTDETEGLHRFRVVTGLDGLTSVMLDNLNDGHVYEITPIVPPEYELTTAEHVRLGTAELDAAPIRFGFALLPGQPTPTPRPMADLTCAPIFASDIGDGNLETMLPGPDGSIILAMRREDELRHFAADGTPLPAIPAPPNGSPDRLLFAPDGRAWAWGERIADGLTYLDGGAWISVTPYEYPGDREVYTMAVTVEGELWLGTDVGALRRDPATGEWSRYAATEMITGVIPAIDGTVWLLTIWGNPWELTPGDAPGQFEEIEHYPRHPVQHIDHGAFWQSPGLWVVTGLGLTKWVNEAQEWAIYDSYSTDNDLPPAIIWDYSRAADGSLWLALADELVHAWPEDDRWVLAPLPEAVEGSIVTVEAAADGSVWIGTQAPSFVYRCTP